MSMLLDALKKSEQQRRLGAKPDIHSAVDEPAGRASEPLGRWLPVVLVVVAVLVMAWFGWRQFAPPPATVDVDAPALAERGTAAPATPDETESATPPQAAAAGPRTPVETYSAPPPAASPGPAAATPAMPPPSAIPVRQAARPAPSPTPPASGEPYRPAVMSYWELPQGVRDGLPQFRVTVLVYAEDPADRFLLVNGVRLKEKDELQAGVVLDEIRRDGAVFRARNYRFLVKG